MLMRFAKVLEDGTYIKPKNEKILYGNMLGNRATLTLRMSLTLACAVTIAIRYSLVRRQSELKPNAPEPQILDFQTQQHKLFPLLAQCFAFRFAGRALSQLFKDVMAEVERGTFTRLIEAHGLSAGMKALITSRTMTGVEVCRLACGGHGYSLASNFPALYGESAAASTVEGEATVLLLQTARYLMKNCIHAQSNKRIDTYMSYLNPGAAILSAKFDGSFELGSILQAYEFRAARLAIDVATRLQNLVAKFSQEEAWNQSTVYLAKAALAHTEYVIMRLFIEQVGKLVCRREVRKAVTTLCLLYCINGIQQNAGDLLKDGYLTGADLDAAREKQFSLYQEIRPNAAAYVDAFDIDDRILDSCLGRYDGNVYESLYEWAQKSQLNQSQVHESFEKYLKPLQTLSKL